DLSYYKGRLYLYWGITPALILFWPFVALTGEYLFHRQAVIIFCSLGFLASAGVLGDLWRRYFAGLSVGVVAACVLALGLATGVPVLLARSDVYEVPISCGYMLTMLALGAIWCALHEPEPRKRSGWLAAASVAYGLAVGARPTLLFGGVILLVPVVRAWRERRPVGALLVAAMGPIILIGLGLMLYNARRFDNPFEFGQHYQVSVERQVARQFFRLQYFWFNFRVYFLEPARWDTRFPFVHGITVPPLPAGYAMVETPFGVLTNIPVVWLALAVPLAWRNRSAETASFLRWFVVAVTLLFGMCALTLALYESAMFRYQVDFVPAMVLLAVVGILGLERALAERLVWRRVARWGWGLLLGFSVTATLLARFERYGDAHNLLGFYLGQSGRMPEAIEQFEQALRFDPDKAEAHYNLGVALAQTGKPREAIEQLERAVRIKPDYPDAHYNLGVTFRQMGRIEEAMGHWEEALRLKPDLAEAHNNLGLALAQTGRVPEAIEHLEQALRIKPDSAEAHNNLGMVLEQAGRIQEAVGHWEQALRIKPDYAEAHNNLGLALAQTGRVPEAIEHLEHALQIKPDYAEAHNNLGIGLAKAGRIQEAVGHWEQALRIKPDYAEPHNNLGTVLMQSGRIPEAIEHLEHALQIKPDYAEAHYSLGAALEQAGRLQDAIGHYQQALRIKPDFTAAQSALVRLQAGQ
ncbi:MAG: tetratricopeptide repeat protein, partial [Verrucomicrobiia bacterium]